MILFTVKLLSYTIAISVWAIVGLYVWVPALFAATIFYVVAVFAVAFLSDKKLRWQAETTLDNVATIYKNGFPKLHHAIWDRKPEEASAGLGAEAIGKFLLISLLSLVGATALWYCFWYFVLMHIFLE